MHDVLRIGGQYKATAMKKAVEVSFQHVKNEMDCKRQLRKTGREID